VRGQGRFAFVVVAVMLVMVAVWTWLPPTEGTRAAIEDALVSFHAARYLVWPEGRYDEDTLPPAVQEALRARWREGIEAVAEGHALEVELGDDPVARLLKAPRRLDGRLPLQYGGEVVYLDFKRRTPRGELKVSAAVDVILTTGRWDTGRGEIVDLAEDWPDEWCTVSVYTLRQHGDTWRVVDVEPASGPNGGPPYFYNPATGEFTQDPGA
jgi:hypothetical protein